MSAFRDPFGAAARTLKTEVVVYKCDKERRIKEGDCNGLSCTEWNCCSGTTDRKYAKNIGKTMRFVWDERAEALREVDETDETPKPEPVPASFFEKWKEGKTGVEKLIADKILMDWKVEQWPEEVKNGIHRR